MNSLELKINILYVIICVYILYKIYNKNTENFAVIDDVKSAINDVYKADVDAIRNLSAIASKLQAGGATVPGNLTVTGNSNLNGTITTGQRIFAATGNRGGGIWVDGTGEGNKGSFVGCQGDGSVWVWQDTVNVTKFDKNNIVLNAPVTVTNNNLSINNSLLLQGGPFSNGDTNSYIQTTIANADLYLGSRDANNAQGSYIVLSRNKCCYINGAVEVQKDKVVFTKPTQKTFVAKGTFTCPTGVNSVCVSTQNDGNLITIANNTINFNYAGSYFIMLNIVFPDSANECMDNCRAGYERGNSIGIINGSVTSFFSGNCNWNGNSYNVSVTSSGYDISYKTNNSNRNYPGTYDLRFIAIVTSPGPWNINFGAQLKINSTSTYTIMQL